MQNQRIYRRLLLTLLLLLQLAGLSWAQLAPSYNDFQTRLTQLGQAQDYPGLVDLIQNNPKLAGQMFTNTANQYPSMSDQNKKVAVVLCNTIARVFDLRLHDPGYVIFLKEKNVYMPDSMWKGTLLERKE